MCLDHNKGCGDFECSTKTKRLKRVAKFTQIPGDRTGNQTGPARSATNAPTAATIENVVAGSRASIVDLTEKREQKKKRAQAKGGKMEDDDGNDADVEEPDDFIDKMVARYQMDHEKLKKKLEAMPPSSMPHKQNRNSIQSGGSFHNIQEDQQDNKL